MRHISAGSAVALKVPREDLDASQLPTPHFIKLDVEGMELAALQGILRSVSAAQRPMAP